MILLKESAGDIKLCKFIGVIMKKVPGIMERLYSEELGGYFLLNTYIYNIETKEHDYDYVIHTDMIDSLPHEIRKPMMKGEGFWGFVDWFNSVSKKRYYLANTANLNSKQKEWVKKQVVAAIGSGFDMEVGS